MNCDELVQTVLHECGLDPHDCDVHVGFDGGQGILKIGFTITERTDSVKEAGRSKYSEVYFLYQEQNSYGNIAGCCPQVIKTLLS